MISRKKVPDNGAIDVSDARLQALRQQLDAQLKPLLRSQDFSRVAPLNSRITMKEPTARARTSPWIRALMPDVGSLRASSSSKQVILRNGLSSNLSLFPYRDLGNHDSPRCLRAEDVH
jgi:hypothetical protein